MPRLHSNAAHGRRPGAGADDCGRRARVSKQTGAADHSVSTRRQQRRGRPADRHASGRSARQAGGGRQSRRGAGGGVGSEGAAHSPPDGYTLLIISLAHAVNPWLYKLPYDPVKAFTPVAILASGPNVLVVNPELPVHSVKELLAAAKEKPGQLQYASAGIGSFQHLG